MSSKSSFIGPVLAVTLVLAPTIAWVGNIYKFTQCDFESNYKCEAIHAAGLLPYVSLVTVWYGTDEEKVDE